MVIPPFGVCSPYASWRRNSLGKTGPAIPSRCAGEATGPLERETVILAGVAGLLGCGAQKDWWQDKVLGDPVSWFRLWD